MDENAYSQGSNAAWRAMLGECLRHLGAEDSDAARVRWVAERADIVAALRRVCADFGDNDWPDDAHLGDVIDKHLHDHLAAPLPPSGDV